MPTVYDAPLPKRTKACEADPPRASLQYDNRFSWPDIKDKEENDAKFCYGLKDHIGILVDGSVVPCCLDAEGDIILGNIFSSSLEEILSHPRALAIIKGFQERQATEELCRKCKYANKF